VKITFVPSLLKVAECQNAKLGSITSSIRTGLTGSEMSIRIPLPWQAPAASPTAGNAVMSWQALVALVRWVPGPWSPPGHRPCGLLVTGSAISRAWLTMKAVSGAASGTWITSTRNREVRIGLPSSSR
jgi:hypothetical protein